MSTHLAPYTDMQAQCMIHYQFIEESLRFCLYRCHTLIQLRLAEKLSYAVPLKMIDEAAMGRLIELFKPYTGNESLISKLRLINNHRDALAHQGLMLIDDEQEQEGDEILSNQSPELKAFLSEAEQCVAMIRQEARSINGLVKQEYQRLEQEQALPDADIIPPLGYER